jgi:hypothetical protein
MGKREEEEAKHGTGGVKVPKYRTSGRMVGVREIAGQSRTAKLGMAHTVRVPPSRPCGWPPFHFCAGGGGPLRTVQNPACFLRGLRICYRPGRAWTGTHDCMDGDYGHNGGREQKKPGDLLTLLTLSASADTPVQGTMSYSGNRLGTVVQ